MNEFLFSEEFTPAAPTTMNENGLSIYTEDSAKL